MNYVLFYTEFCLKVLPVMNVSYIEERIAKNMLSFCRFTSFVKVTNVFGLSIHSERHGFC